MSSNVRGFPVRDPRRVSGGVLSRHDLEHGPVEAIRELGSLVATGHLAAQLERVEAIVHAMAGPGRVYLVDGVHVAIDLLEQILASAIAEATTATPAATARQVTAW